ncbi:hypothetical protein ACWGII_43015 [Streptomyces sp. NPDC054855]
MKSMLAGAGVALAGAILVVAVQPSAQAAPAENSVTVSHASEEAGNEPRVLNVARLATRYGADAGRAVGNAARAASNRYAILRGLISGDPVTVEEAVFDR